MLLGAEADEAVVIEIDLEGAVACHESEDSQVVLKAVKEVRVRNVFGRHEETRNQLTLGHVCLVPDHAHSSTARCVFWSAHPEAAFASHALLEELGVLFHVGQHIGFRHEVELCWVLGPKTGKIWQEQVFLRHMLGSKETVNFLVLVNGGEVLRIQIRRNPHIVVRILFDLLLKLGNCKA